MYRLTLAIVGVVLIVSMLFAPTMAFAADYEEEGTTSSVTVSTVVDITLSNVPIAWGTLALKYRE